MDNLDELERLIIERTKLAVAVNTIGWDVPIRVGYNEILCGDRVRELDVIISEIKQNIMTQLIKANLQEQAKPEC